MRIFPHNATLADFIAARRDDAREVATLQTQKADGRCRSGLRAVPTSKTDVIAGDMAGDYLQSSNILYMLVRDSTSSLVWHKITNEW